MDEVKIGMDDRGDGLVYRCRYVQDPPFWGATRPNCIRGLTSRGILNEGVECAKCDKYNAGKRVYKVPFHSMF